MAFYYDRTRNLTLASTGLYAMSVLPASQGDSYTSAPTPIIIGDGSGATGTSTLSAGRVLKSLSIVGGTGYGPNTQAVFSGGGGSGIAVNLIITAGVITGYVIINSGDNFTSLPTVTLTNTGGGTGASLTPVLSTGRVVKSITIVNPGVGYSNAIALLVGGGGSGARGGAPLVFTNASIGFGTSNGVIFQMTDAGNAPLVNYLDVIGAPTGGPVIVSVTGSDTNVAMGLLTQGTGGFTFASGNGDILTLNDPATGTIANYLSVTAAASGSAVVLSAAGSANASMHIKPNGSGTLLLDGVVISGGTMNNTVIGGTTPADATVHNLTVTGTANLLNPVGFSDITITDSATITGGLTLDFLAAGNLNAGTVTYPVSNLLAQTLTLETLLSAFGTDLPLQWFENNATIASTGGVTSTAGYYLSSATAPNSTDPGNIGPGFILQQAVNYISAINSANANQPMLAIIIPAGNWDLGTYNIQIPAVGFVHIKADRNARIVHGANTDLVSASGGTGTHIIIEGGSWGKRGDWQFISANGSETVNGDPHVIEYTSNTQNVPGSTTQYLPGGIVRVPLYVGDSSNNNGNGGDIPVVWGGNVFSVFANNVQLIDVEVCGFGPYRAFLVGGDNITMRNPQVWCSSGTAGSAGIRFSNGHDFLCIGARGVSGDDFLQFVNGATWVNDFSSPSGGSISDGTAEQGNCTRCVYIGCDVLTLEGRPMIADMGIGNGSNVFALTELHNSTVGTYNGSPCTILSFSTLSGTLINSSDTGTVTVGMYLRAANLQSPTVADSYKVQYVDTVNNLVYLNGVGLGTVNANEQVYFIDGPPPGALNRRFTDSGWIGCRTVAAGVYGIAIGVDSSSVPSDFFITDCSVECKYAYFGALADAQGSAGTSISLSTTNNFDWINYQLGSNVGGLYVNCPGYTNGFVQVYGINGTTILLTEATTAAIPANAVVYFSNFATPHVGLSAGGGTIAGISATIKNLRITNQFGSAFNFNSQFNQLTLRDCYFDAPIAPTQSSDVGAPLSGGIYNCYFNGNNTSTVPVLTIGTATTVQNDGSVLGGTVVSFTIENNHFANVNTGQNALLIDYSTGVNVIGNTFTSSGANVAGGAIVPLITQTQNAYFTTFDYNDLTQIPAAQAYIAYNALDASSAPTNVVIGVSNKIPTGSSLLPVLSAQFTSGVEQSLNTLVDNVSIKLVNNQLIATGSVVGPLLSTYMNLSSYANIGGSLTVGNNSTGQTYVLIRSPAGQMKKLSFAQLNAASTTAAQSQPVWDIIVQDAASGSVSNSGGNFYLVSYNDAGTTLDPAVISINRASSLVSFSQSVVVTGNLQVNGTITSNGVISASDLTITANKGNAYAWIAPIGGGAPTWRRITTQDIVGYGGAGGSVFGASGINHSIGLVPDPGATAGSSRFLCENGTWSVPAGSGGGGSSTLSGLTDVSITEGSPINGYFLQYNATSGLWTAASIAGRSLATLTDVAVTESAGIDGYYLRWSQGTGKWIASQIIIPSYTVFGASGAGHAVGLVPDPGATAGNSRFLCENGTWSTPAGSGGASTLSGLSDVTVVESSAINGYVLTYNAASSAWVASLNSPAVFGASGSAHSIGAVPDPGASAGTMRFLCENATWVNPPGADLTAGAVLSTGTTLQAWPQGQNCPRSWFHPNLGIDGQIEMVEAVSETVQVPANLAGMAFTALTNPASPVVFTFAVYQNGVWSNICTITIATDGTWSVSAFSAFNLLGGQNQAWKLTGPTYADANMANYAFSLMFIRQRTL